jgi:hypothetical protein
MANRMKVLVCYDGSKCADAGAVLYVEMDGAGVRVLEQPPPVAGC